MAIPSKTQPPPNRVFMYFDFHRFAGHRVLTHVFFLFPTKIPKNISDEGMVGSKGLCAGGILWVVGIDGHGLVDDIYSGRFWACTVK